MNELFEPAPRRHELWVLTAQGWAAVLALLLGTTETPAPGDVALLAALALCCVIPLHAVTRTTELRPLLRRTGAAAVGAGVAVTTALAASLRELDFARLWSFFLVVSFATPVAGALLSTPLLLLARSMRLRGAVRHRGREARVVGGVGCGALLWLALTTSDVLRGQPDCGCFGPHVIERSVLVSYVGTVATITGITVISLARGVWWEARVRALLRRAIAGTLVGWAVRDAGPVEPGEALELHATTSWACLLRVGGAGGADPYRHTTDEAPVGPTFPAKVRRVGSVQVANVVLLLTAVLLAAAVADDIRLAVRPAGH